MSLSGIVGQDGVTTYNDTNLGTVARQELTIRLPQKMYVADVRSGKQLGYTDVVHTSILIGDAIVLGLSPEENRIEMDGISSAKRGDHVSLNLISTTNDSNLVRCHVFAPDGSRVSMYLSNVL